MDTEYRIVWCGIIAFAFLVFTALNVAVGSWGWAAFNAGCFFIYLTLTAVQIIGVYIENSRS